MEDAVLIQLSHVSKHFFHQEGIVPVLHDISFSLSAGEIAAMLGPSGCGKCCRCLSGDGCTDKPVEHGAVGRVDSRQL